ncbi:MAG: hypothetical protein VW405_02615 [Rhodospirillaceae bacterium]
MSKSYTITSQAWYGLHPVIDRGFTEEIAVEGDGFCDLLIRWKNLGDNREPAARVECFEDAWACFAADPDLFADLATLTGLNPKPSDVVAVLEAHGYEDATERENPNPTQPPRCQSCGHVLEGGDR